MNKANGGDGIPVDPFSPFPAGMNDAGKGIFCKEEGADGCDVLRIYREPCRRHRIRVGGDGQDGEDTAGREY